MITDLDGKFYDAFEIWINTLTLHTLNGKYYDMEI